MIVEPKADQVVWLDGEFIPWSSATMHVWDHHYGVGVFEGVRAYDTPSGPQVFRLCDHTQRLFRSARMIGLAIPPRFDAATLNDVQVELLRRNGLRSAYLRPFVFRSGISGLAPRAQGLRVRVAAIAVEWSDDPASTSPPKGVTLRTASYVRTGGCLPIKAKANANYIAGILAHEEALSAGADDALLMDTDGFVAESTGSNVFIVQGAAIFTPPADLILAGITRDTIMMLGRAAGLRVEERRLSREDLLAADEAFLTGTAAEVTHVRALDGKSIGEGSIGPVTSSLGRAYSELVRGRSSDHRDWLTSVSKATQ